MNWVLLDNNLTPDGEALLFEAPLDLAVAWHAGDVEPALQKLERAWSEGLYAAGFACYELGYLLDPKLASLIPQKRKMPLLWFGIYQAPRQFDRKRLTEWLAAKASPDYAFVPKGVAMTRAAYSKQFAEVQRLIAAGDIYQLNLTFKGRFKLGGSPLALFADLRRKQKVAYGAVISADDFTILSLSPELFLEIENGQMSTRPMKGTAGRGRTLAEDSAIRDGLAADPKSQAENLMIVDLMRNDLGRLAEPGSVNVSDLFTVETYPTLHQMTSGVTARLRDNANLKTILRGLFPPGSVTGAPKIRAVELIRALEDEPRGVYTGAIGLLAPGGRARFNVAIRTLTLSADGEGEIGIGSGLVHESKADAEYDECLLKMRFLTDPMTFTDFQLIETLRFAPGSGYDYFDEHIERLTQSAAYFGFLWEREAVVTSLENKAMSLGGPHRVRLLLAENGSIEISAFPMTAPAPGAVQRFMFSDKIMESSNVFLYHKTTNRQIYDEDFARLTEAHSCDEVLYVNERGELTEGSRTNIFIERNGILLTPALSCGLLPGTLRARLLIEGKARETILKHKDLESAETIYIGNSVRGLMRAEPLAMDHPVRSIAS